jgi:hypothetical protein
MGGVDKWCRGGTREGWRCSVADRKAWNGRAAHGGSGWLFPADEMMREKRGWGSGRAMEEGDRGVGGGV